MSIALLCGCKAEPKGQIVAILNGEQISIQEIYAEAVGRQFPAGDRKQIQRDLLELLIDRKLMVQQAKKLNLDASPEYAARRQTADENLLAALYERQLAQNVPPPDPHEIAAYIDAHPSQFAHREKLTIDEIQFVPPRDVKRLAALTGAHSMNDMAADLQQSGIAYSRGIASLDTSNLAPAISQKIDGLPPQEPFVLYSGRKFVAGAVVARDIIPTPPDVATAVAATALRGEALARERRAELGLARSKGKITYPPGSGS